MGNVNSQYRAYICLLKHLLEARRARVSDQKLEELLQVIETHCPWFPNLGTLDLKTWRKVGTELRKLYHIGVSLPVTIWDTWRLIRSVLKPLQTDEKDTGKKKVQKSEKKEEGSLTALTVYTPWSPQLPLLICCRWLLQHVNGIHLRSRKRKRLILFFLPAGAPSGGSPAVLSAVEKGIRQVRLEGDIEAFAFPVVIRERFTPEANPDHPNIVQEFSHEPFSFKLLKELKQAVTQYGPTSPYTMGLIWSAADGNRLIPTDWNTLARTCLSSFQFLQFKTWWIDGAETQARLNQTLNIVIVKDQLLGSGHWENPQDQIGMNKQAIKQVQRICLTAWGKIEFY
ncbi:endogenous retrovirus group K member 9 Gag polyprotein-like [Rhinolophus ferrumequinum]|uniref:endogenous retrovirus group K member 9 Gag polyprotein-like n=1 Tax=Rhinolophus ferrumequinum TaxID=59479 RepID=UPI00140F65EE|nr:endogenous retrovirus group K member 9 Gag polyprotein-like [Rhinolophus ferrumequinum]